MVRFILSMIFLATLLNANLALAIPTTKKRVTCLSLLSGQSRLNESSLQSAFYEDRSNQYSEGFSNSMKQDEAPRFDENAESSDTSSPLF